MPSAYCVRSWRAIFLWYLSSCLLEKYFFRYHRCTCATDFFLLNLLQGVAYQKQLLRLKLMGALAKGASKKFGTLYLFLQPLNFNSVVAILQPPTSILVYDLSLGTSLLKQLLGPKLAGVWARWASKKFGTPYLFLQSLKLETSNLVYNLGLPCSLTTKNF